MLIEDGRTLDEAAMKSGMSEVTARRYRRLGMLPSEAQKRHDWRTHRDAFEEVWPEVLALLEREPGLQAKSVFEELCRLYPGVFQEGQLRTLQRRIKHWRATEGPGKEVIFPQVHEPGRLGASDFTHCGSLGVTIGRQPFDHLLFHFVLTFSNWEHVSICASESFESLSEGLQAALWALGGVPARHRTDQLSAAVRKLSGGGEAFTLRYEALLSHYGIAGEKTQPSSPNENGDSEQSHHRLKEAVDQALMLRGSRDFDTIEDYQAFLYYIVESRNDQRKKRFEEERSCLHPLPARALDACRELAVRVGPSSTIRVAHNTYSVPSRLIGERVDVRLFSGHLEVWLGGTKVCGPIERLRGENRARIDYRHVIDSLVRKPGAFARYRHREELFPTSRFRMAYDALLLHSTKRPDKEYLNILRYSAKDGEVAVDEALRSMIDGEETITAARVKELVDRGRGTSPPRDVHVEPAALCDYDALLLEVAQ